MEVTWEHYIFWKEEKEFDADLVILSWGGGVIFQIVAQAITLNKPFESDFKSKFKWKENKNRHML